MPDTRVYLAFGSGYSTPDASRTWTDVSDYVEAEQLISITRGRADELSDVQPSTCSVVLDNRDGRFTPGYASGAYYPNVTKGVPLRVTVTHSGTERDRFTGYVDEWPLMWPDATESASLVRVTATSRTARVARHESLRSVVEEELLLDSPELYYPLNEPEGATSGGSIAPATMPRLTRAGTGSTVTFGTSTGVGTDEASAPTWQGGKWLQAGMPAINPGVSLGISCFVFVFNTSGTSVQLVGTKRTGFTPSVFLIDANGKLADEQDGTNFTSSSSFNDGATHVVHQIFTGSATEIYVDGVLVGANESIYFGDDTTLYVGGGVPGLSQATLAGTVSHIAFYLDDLTSTRRADHIEAMTTGFEGETTDARIERLSAWAGIPAAEVSTEAGQATMSAILSTGKTVAALMKSAVDTEGGAAMLFDAPDGSLVFQARNHRYGAAVHVTLDAELGEVEAMFDPVLNDFGMLNDVTTTNPAGESERAVDTASVDEFGVYSTSIEIHATDEDDLRAAAEWRAGTYGQPRVRVPSVSVDVGNCSDAQKALLLTLELGDLISAANLPTQAPSSSLDLFVEGYTETIGSTSHVMTINTSEAAAFDVWQLDSATHSQLGSTTRLGY